MLKLQTRLFSTTALNEVRNFNQLPGPKPSVPLVGTSWQYLKFIGKCLADDTSRLDGSFMVKLFPKRYRSV